MAFVKGWDRKDHVIGPGRTILAVIAVAVTFAVALAVQVIALGLLFHAVDRDIGAWGPIVGVLILTIAALAGIATVRRLGFSRRASLRVGGGTCALTYLLIAVSAPSRPLRDWSATPPGQAVPPTADYAPILLLDRSEPEHPWYVSARLATSGSRTRIDYWWAFTANRSPSLRDAACLPALAVMRWTCFDHDGDLEGVTVVIRGGRPESVWFAAHSGVTRVGWTELKHDGDRPLVFVANGSHASYPDPCSANCRGPGRSVIGSTPEGNHDGSRRVDLAAGPTRVERRRQCLLPGLCIRGDEPPPVSKQHRRIGD